MPEHDDEERDLRIELMTVQIEKLRKEIRMESRKVAWQAVASIAAAFTAGAAIFGLILHLSGRL
jgi:hypothetical protein